LLPTGLIFAKQSLATSTGLGETSRGDPDGYGPAKLTNQSRLELGLAQLSNCAANRRH